MSNIPSTIYIDLWRFSNPHKQSQANTDYKSFYFRDYEVKDALQMLNNLVVLERSQGITLGLKEESQKRAEQTIQAISQWCQKRFIQPPSFRVILINEMPLESSIMIDNIKRTFVSYSNQMITTQQQIEEYTSQLLNNFEPIQGQYSNSTACTEIKDQILDQSIHTNESVQNVGLSSNSYQNSEGHQTHLGNNLYIKCSQKALGSINQQQVYIEPDNSDEIKELICIQFYESCGVLTPKYRFTKDYAVPQYLQSQYQYIPFIDQPLYQLEIQRPQSNHIYVDLSTIQLYLETQKQLKINGKEVKGFGKVLAVAGFLEDPYIFGKKQGENYQFDNMILYQTQDSYQVGIREADGFFLDNQDQYEPPILKPNQLNQYDLAEYDEVMDKIINGDILSMVEEKLSYINQFQIVEELMDLLRDKVQKIKHQIKLESSEPPKKSVLASYGVESSSSDEEDN